MSRDHSHRSRTAAGTPAGGQFATEVRAEPAVTLGGGTQGQTAEAWIYIERSTGQVDAVGPYPSEALAYGAMNASELIDGEAQVDAYEVWVEPTSPDHGAVRDQMREALAPWATSDAGAANDDRLLGELARTASHGDMRAICDRYGVRHRHTGAPASGDVRLLAQLSAARAAKADPDTLLGIDDDFATTDAGQRWARTVEGIDARPELAVPDAMSNLADPGAGIEYRDDDDGHFVLEELDGRKFVVTEACPEDGNVTGWTYQALLRDADGTVRPISDPISVDAGDHFRLIHAAHTWRHSEPVQTTAAKR